MRLVIIVWCGGNLPTRFGGLGFKIFSEIAEMDHQDSSNLRNQILRTNDNGDKTKHQIRTNREKRNKEKLQQFVNVSDDETKRKIVKLNQKEIENWLTTIYIKILGTSWQSRNSGTLFAFCMMVCGTFFDVTNALCCKKGGFITLKRNEEDDTTAELFNDIFVNVRKESILLELNNQALPRQANNSEESRLNIIWTTGWRTFLNIRVFNLFARRPRKLEVKKSFRSNENEIKQLYDERVLQVENGSFTALVFDINDGMGKECFRL